MKRTAATVAAILAAALTGCSGQDQSPATAQKPTGPVQIDYWSWTAGVDKQVAAWNAAHPDVHVTYTNVAGDLAYDKMRAATKAGNAPCLARMDAMNTVTFAADGLLEDVGAYTAPLKDTFTQAAWNQVSPGGITVGLPQASAPNFYAYRTDLFDEYGLQVPKTWDELIATGEKAAAARKGTKIWNMAGEDPSTFVGLSWQAGATWYKAAGDHWEINFTSPATLKAADVLQRLIDHDLFSSASYADPGVWKTWDDGTTISMGTSTWQLPIYAQNFPKTAGKWALAQLPQYTGASPSTDGGFTNAVVLKGCEHPEQAVRFAAWLATDPAPVKALSDPNSGAGFFPALKDVNPYLADLAPKKMFGDVDSTRVIAQAAQTVNPTWQHGPNYATMYAEMQKLWPEVLGKKMKVTEMVNRLQQFTLDDLKAKGINATAGA
ncbi:ABC transporter substrate-binding protein [Streptosporangium sp. 'caverna']|uniref:ABC transporter substrate-binding protein n=1 Tax=Streptosporangium sp. 'caverna' TaxID=2202249 RepID=UPI000D7D50D2|nr:extracellular solute-binding protein [Streptosporangium sp. 'caverna']AWS43605.1 ABC transporter substrate-binding protein [Streptosporangium sp. 'caverna']